MQRQSLSFAVDEVFRESGFISINSDKNKSDEYKQNMEAGAKTKHEIASGVHIHQSETLQKYKSITKEFFHSCRANHGSQDYKTYNDENVRNFLADKIADGCAYNTFQGYCSALEKLDDMLNKIDGGARDWHGVICEMREIANDVCPHTDIGGRAYDNPMAVINAMDRPETALSALLEYKTGLRAGDVTGQIKLNADGTLDIKSKAGFHAPNFEIPKDLYEKIESYSKNGEMAFLCKYDAYRYDLQKACEATGEKYSGTHGFRYNFAQEDYAKYKSQGMTDKEAKAHTSEDLFHHRLNIVDVYLR